MTVSSSFSFALRVRSLLVAGAFALPLFAAVPAAQAQSAPAKPRIVVIGTGGTIAGAGKSSANTSSYATASVKVDDLVKNLPELADIAQVRSEQIFQIGSKSMTDARMVQLSKRIQQLLQQDDVDGVVVTHGTDTLEETAYLAHLTIKSTKPVVFAASMRPGTALSADGPLNLYNAVVLAGSPEAADKGVLVSMNDEIHTARDVAKRNSFKTDTFESPYGPLGNVVEGKPVFYRLPARAHTTKTEFDIGKIDTLPRVDIAYGYANVDGTAYEAFARAGAKAIINAGTGNANFSDNVLPAVKKVRADGVFVVRSSRTGAGAFYRSDAKMDESNGWIVADDQTPQKARILMALALTRTTDLAELRRTFSRY